jgi:predicted phage tail protein
LTVEVQVPCGLAAANFDGQGHWIRSLETLSKAFLWMSPTLGRPGSDQSSILVYFTGNFRSVKAAQQIINIFLAS